MKRYLFSSLFLPLLLYLFSSAFWLDQIAFDNYLDFYSFSPDSHSFIYLIRDLNQNNYKLYWQKINENKAQFMARFDVKPVDIQWFDGQTIYYLKNGQLFQYSLLGQKEAPLDIKTSYYWLKDKKIYYRLADDNGHSLWFYDLENKRRQKILAFDKKIIGFNLSPQLSKIALSYYQEAAPATALAIFDLENQNFIPFDCPHVLEKAKASLPFWKDENIFAFALDDIKDYKERLYFMTDLKNQKTIQIYQTFKGLYNEPNGQWQNNDFYLISSEDGWRHLYRISPVGAIKKITEGNYEISAFDFINEQEIIFAANKDNIRYWDLYHLNLKTNQLKKISLFDGTHTDFVLSPDFKKLLFSYSGPTQSTALYLMDLEANNFKLVFNSLPPIFDLTNLVFPQAITISGQKDKLYGWLWLPKNFDESKKYPALIWLHGGPAGQIMFGWHNYLSYGNFYSFFQYLLSKDYVILGLDYSGSTGYGEDYLSSLFSQGGFKDVSDVFSAGKYLKSLNYIDSNHISLLGFSYGGYLVNKTLVQDEEKIFNKGIAISGPTDWSAMLSPNSHPIFHLIFGGWPEENKELYQKVEVVNQAQNLQVPLLVIHGLFDNTVPLSQAKLWLSALEKFKKPVSSYYYSAGHVPSTKSIWVEIFKKIEDFLNSD